MNILQSIEKVFFANGRYWGGLNSSLYNSGSIWAMNTGIESADLNMVWNEKPLTAGNLKDIQYIKNHFRKAHLPFWWWVFPGASSPSTGNMLKAEGLSLVVSVPSMFADLTSWVGESTDNNLQIRQIKNKEDLSLWEEVSFAGFDFPRETRHQYHRFIGTFNLNADSPQKFFLALVNHQPVATSLLFLHENAGGVYFVSTLASERKKGIGLTLTLATMRFAKKAGAAFVTLQSSPDGFKVYEQAGFEECCKVDVYSLASQ